MEGTKRKLSLNLSFLNLTDFKRQSSARKSPRNFEQPDGAVGLGILAAVNDHRCGGDPDLNRKAVVAISPKSASNAIPILGKNGFFKENRGGNVGWEKTDEYTCVISHVGENVIEKREYFGSVSAESVIGSTHVSFSGSRGTKAVPSSSFGELMASDFLNYCSLCKKMLQGLDIFMYRGDMAFCSSECRDEQISIEKKEAKCQSRLKKQQMEYSVSPCSDPKSFSAKVVAA